MSHFIFRTSFNFSNAMSTVAGVVKKKARKNAATFATKPLMYQYLTDKFSLQNNKKPSLTF